MRVLVVEDEKKVAKALREGLEAEHYDVRVASSGEEGFFLVNHEAFDCVVLDLMLPQRDGPAAAFFPSFVIMLAILPTLDSQPLNGESPKPWRICSWRT